MVEQKDVIIALTGASATMSSLSLVLLGFIASVRASDARRLSLVALGYGAAATFIFGLFTTVSSLQWLYAMAPGSQSIARGIWFDANRVYESAWIGFFLTCLGILYIAIVATVFMLPRPWESVDGSDDVSGSSLRQELVDARQQHGPTVTAAGRMQRPHDRVVQGKFLTNIAVVSYVLGAVFIARARRRR